MNGNIYFQCHALSGPLPTKNNIGEFQGIILTIKMLRDKKQSAYLEILD